MPVDFSTLTRYTIKAITRSQVTPAHRKKGVNPMRKNQIRNDHAVVHSYYRFMKVRYAGLFVLLGS